MLLTALLPLLLSLLVADDVAAPAPEVTATALSPAGPAAEELTAAWEADVLVLTGIAPGSQLRVYDVVGHVLADFRSESPRVRLQLPRRQLVAVCSAGHCVGAR